jgi:hypothetical protein
MKTMADWVEKVGFNRKRDLEARAMAPDDGRSDEDQGRRRSPGRARRAARLARDRVRDALDALAGALPRPEARPVLVPVPVETRRARALRDRGFGN